MLAAAGGESDGRLESTSPMKPLSMVDSTSWKITGCSAAAAMLMLLLLSLMYADLMANGCHANANAKRRNETELIGVQYSLAALISDNSNVV